MSRDQVREHMLAERIDERAQVLADVVKVNLFEPEPAEFAQPRRVSSGVGGHQNRLPDVLRAHVGSGEVELLERLVGLGLQDRAQPLQFLGDQPPQQLGIDVRSGRGQQLGRAEHAHHASFGGAGGFLGLPTGELTTVAPGVSRQVFSGGQVVTSARGTLHVRGGLEALVARPVYYELADLALAGDGPVPGVWSDGVFFPVAAA